MKNLHKKILAVMEEVGSISKDKKNTFHNYNYVSDVAVVEAIRELLIKHKLILVPSQVSCLKEQDVTTLLINYSLIDVETGESLLSSIYGQGQDKGDKGVYKAMTGAEKYYLLKTFLIPTSDDPENSNNETSSATQYKKTAEETPAQSSGSFTATTTLEELKDFVSKKGKPYYRIIDNEGATYTVFDKNIADQARELIKNRSSVIVTYEKDQYGMKIKELEVI